MKSKIICYLYLIVCVYISFNRDQVGKFNNFHYDSNGYYIYLPATFIYHDLAQLAFQPEAVEKHQILGGPYYAIFDVNGKKINKYAIGTAVAELPLFLVAHAYCLITQGPESMPDGYSKPYEYALVFTNILWSFLGLLVLRRSLLRLFKDNTAAVVIACIGFGTNFYTYGAFHPGMSHNFSFFLFACLLYFTDKWHQARDRKSICAIGLVLGLIIITRPVNIIAILIPLLWGVYSKETFLRQVKMIYAYWKDVLLAAICFLLIAGIQIGYWKYTSGQLIYFSYLGEEFNFARPNILKGLFSFRKGWFVYTPIAFIGITGLVFTPKRYLPAIAVFFAVMIYVVFSWENWYYGGGFGARAMIETLPIVAVPLGFVTQSVLEKGKLLIRSVYLTLLSFLVVLSLFQSYQFSRGLINYERMSREAYWYIFGKLEPGPDYQKLLMPQEEFRAEIDKWLAE